MKKLAILIAFLAFGQMIAQTIINSDITTNTTWTLSGSPYIVTDTIEVRTGVRLEIDPDVRILVNEHARIEVDGELSAIGGPTDSIIFTLDTASATSNIGWRGIRAVGKVEMAYCVIERAQYGLNMEGNHYTLILEHCTFRLNDAGILGDENYNGPWAEIIRCDFMHNFIGIADLYFADIHHCVFHDNHVGANNLWMCDVRGCEFYHHLQNALGIQIGEVVENEFRDNGYACFFGFADYTHPVTGAVHDYHIFRGNVVRDNDAGLRVMLQDTLRIYPHIFSHNTFCDNLIYNVALPWPASTLTFTVNLTENCWCTLDSLSIDSTIIKNQNTHIFWPIDSSCVHHINKPVFPGDANFNQHCNYADLLYLGIAFGETGPVRPNASLSWTPQYGPNWADTLPNGRNLKHADCDGDGVVGFADTVAINQNYGMTHMFSRGGRASGHVPLFLTTATPVFFPGDTVTFEIHLGTSDSVANDIYGIGFTVGYDTSQVEPEMLWLNYSGSWLGNKNQDMITINKDFFSHGRVDIALTRINHMDRNGHGKIADLIIVIDDDLYKRSMPFELTFSGYTAWDDQAEEIALVARDGQFNIEDPNTAITPLFEPKLSLYPVPAQNLLQIHHPGSRLLSSRLYDLQGRQLPTELTLHPQTSQLRMGNLPTGFYLLEMNFEEGKLVKKISIR
jgi:hypothetical protein